jgi:phage replication-related protein YjqB (UPF0714/DUF867 family)
MREFVAAGGELIIHGALLIRNSPTPDLILMKAYKSYKDLEKNEVEEKDYCIRYRHGTSGIAVMAPHGGAIESGTAEVADAVAGRQHSFYAFWGLKAEHNARLHLGSTTFDEPVAVDIARRSHTILTIHGCKEQHHKIYLGGRDNRLKETIFKSLRQSDFSVGESSRLPGLKLENLCNQSRRRKGVQLEISAGLRREFFKDTSVTTLNNNNSFFVILVEALRAALDRDRELSVIR